jgi:hypothetical protein
MCRKFIHRGHICEILIESCGPDWRDKPEDIAHISQLLEKAVSVTKAAIEGEFK